MRRYSLVFQRLADSMPKSPVSFNKKISSSYSEKEASFNPLKLMSMVMLTAFLLYPQTGFSKDFKSASFTNKKMSGIEKRKSLSNDRSDQRLGGPTPQEGGKDRREDPPAAPPQEELDNANIPRVYFSPWVVIKTFTGNYNDPDGWGRNPVWLKGFTDEPDDIQDALKLITFNVHEFYEIGARVFMLRLPVGRVGHMGSNQFKAIPPNFQREIGRTFAELRDQYPDIKIGIYSGFCHNPDPDVVECADEYPQLDNAEHVAVYKDRIQYMQKVLGDQKGAFDFMMLDNFSGVADWEQPGTDKGQWLKNIKEWGNFDFVATEAMQTHTISVNPPIHEVHVERAGMAPSMSLYRFYENYLPNMGDDHVFDPRTEPHFVMLGSMAQELQDTGEMTREEIIAQITCDWGASLHVSSALARANNDHLAEKLQRYKDDFEASVYMTGQCHNYIPEHLQ